MPLDVGAGEHETPEAAGGNGRFHPLRPRAKTGLEDRSQQHPGLCRRLDDAVGAGRRDLEGFFDDYMLAGCDGGERGFEMCAARGRDADHLDV